MKRTVPTYPRHCTGRARRRERTWAPRKPTCSWAPWKRGGSSAGQHKIEFGANFKSNCSRIDLLTSWCFFFFLFVLKNRYPANALTFTRSNQAEPTPPATQVGWGKSRNFAITIGNKGTGNSARGTECIPSHDLRLTSPAQGWGVTELTVTE